MLSLVTAISTEDDISVFAKMLDMASFADEIIVYSMEVPIEKIGHITKKHNAKVINTKKHKIIEAIRDEQVRNTKGDWVLVLDYDEFITPELKKEILSIVNKKTGGNRDRGTENIGAYAIPRQNYSLGFRIKRGGWDDDYQVRLIKKSNFISWPNIIHIVPKVKGEIRHLKHAMKHYKDPSLEYIVNKTNRYSDIEADLFFNGGLGKVTSITLLRKLNMEIIRRGILKLGILDGVIGVIQSIYQGFSVFITYAKLYEKQNKKQ